MIKFRQKEFGLGENVLKGALVGSSIGASVGTISNKLNFKPKFPI